MQRIVTYIANNPTVLTPIYEVYLKYNKDYPYEEYVKQALSMMSGYKVHSIIDPFEIKFIKDDCWEENKIKVYI